tara:strand:- start:72 stop:1301 length:1230 start_codon:yes stop_codon:yes gene_type:complete
MNLKKTLSAAVAAAGLVVVATSAQAAISIDVYGDYGAYFEDFKKDITRKAGDFKHNPNDWGGHHNKLTLNIATGSGAADMTLIDTGMVGGFLGGGGLMDLTDKFAPFKKDMVDFAVKQGQNDKGQQIAVPVDLGPGVAFYRRDYMEDAGYDLDTVMESWDSWLAYGRELRDEYGVYLVSNADSVARSIIYGTVEAGNGIYTGPNNEILIENERFQFAFNMAKTLREEGLDENTGLWNDDWYNGFREGTFAMELQGAWLLGSMSTWIAADTEGSWGASNLPAGIYGTWGGTFAAIPAQTKDVEAAWDVIEYMISPKAQLAAFDEWTMFPANKTVYANELFEAENDFLRGQNANALFAEIARNVIPVQPGAYDNTAETLVINTALAEVLSDGRDVKEALKDAAQQLQKRMR